MPRPRRSPLRPPQLRTPARADDLRHAAYANAPADVRRALRAHVVAYAENRPGVYRMLGATGLVLYVGKAKHLRTRLLSYLRAGRKNRRRDKQARILRMAHAVEWEYCHDEFAALLRELRLIKQHRPRFNGAMNVDEFPRGWIGLTGGDVPGLRVVLRSDDPDATVLYGPFRRLSMLHEAVRALAEATGLRDCELPTSRLATRDSRKRKGSESRVASPGCLRFELGTCSGPCVHAPSRADYDARVSEVRAFLAGRTRTPIEALERAMQAAADAWHFERAGSLKTKLEALRWLEDRLARFHAGADRLTFTYRATGHDGSERVYLIRRGTVRAEVPCPTTPDEEAALARLAARIFDGADPSGADIPTHDLEEFYLVASWFRRHAPDAGRIVDQPAR